MRKIKTHCFSHKVELLVLEMPKVCKRLYQLVVVSRLCIVELGDLLDRIDGVVSIRAGVAESEDL